MTERGMQGKTDINARGWESGDFPALCEGCLGECSFVRMIKDPYGGNCKMCDRPFTMFKWRSGHDYRKTEVCQTCSKIKNICQACILDLQFGLPSQLRDAVLAQSEGYLVEPESDANREYKIQQQLMQIQDGNDPWATRDGPSDRLLKMARAAVQQRDPSGRVQLNFPTPSAAPSPSTTGKRQHDQAFAASDEKPAEISLSETHPPLPPGVSSLDAIDSMNAVPSHILAMLGIKKPAGANPAPPTPAATSAASSDTSTKSSVLPPKPKGPPPPWAFKNKKEAQEPTSTKEELASKPVATDPPSIQT